ncbi:MAG: 50S ribosomal protein L18 [Armatimonadota bacterium]|nr:50S ribosomal protein L18 [Armatimonadota bacterium]
MKAEVDRKRQRQKRHRRARRKLEGTPERPRLAVYVSLQHVYAQVIDDWAGETLLGAATVEDEVAGECSGSTANTEAARVVGRVIAERALDEGIERVCFDTGGRKYHGRVKALADAAREAGLDF